jgi:hypothetical protein
VTAEVRDESAEIVRPEPAMPTGSGRGAALRARELLLPVVAIGIVGSLLAAGNSYLLLDLGLLAGAVVLNNSAPRPGIDPCELSLTVSLAILIGVPFSKLPQNRTTSIVFVIVMVTLGASALISIQASNRPRGRLLVLGLFGFLAVASVLSPDPGALKRLLIIATSAVPAFFLGTCLERRRLRAVSLVVVALALAEAAVAIAEPFAFAGRLWAESQLPVIGAAKSLRNPLYSSLDRSQGTMGHPLVLGLLLVLAIGLVLRVLADLEPVIRLAAVALLLVGLFFTGDRSFLLLAFVMIIVGRRLRLVRTLAWLAGALAAVVLVIDLGTVNGSLVTNFASSGSYLHRISAYGLVWRLFSTQPAAAVFGGNGFGSTQRLFDNGLLQTDGFNVVDNQFVLIQAQGGLICLLLFAALAVMAIVNVSRALRVVLLFVVASSVIFDWLSWSSDSALIFLVLGASLAAGGPSVATPQPDDPEEPVAVLAPRARWEPIEG